MEPVKALTGVLNDLGQITPLGYLGRTIRIRAQHGRFGVLDGLPLDRTDLGLEFENSDSDDLTATELDSIWT